MALAYSKNLASFNLTAPGASSPIVVPAGRTWVIRDVQSRQTASSSNEVYLRLTTNPTLIILTIPAESGNGRSWAGRLVLPAATSFTCNASGASAMVWISGYDLTA